MTTINLNNIGKASQKRIRDDNGVKTITSLINLAKEKGVNVGVKKETQQTGHLLKEKSTKLFLHSKAKKSSKILIIYLFFTT